MENQLKLHATKGDDDAGFFVLLTAVNYAYREHLMNFKCSLERVGMRDHFVIAAMDRQVYEWGVRRGLPIYLAGSAATQQQEQAAESSDLLVVQGSEYGGAGFKAVTKLKSVAVLEVLKKGYSVVWSDVDITWFRHPFVALADFMRKDGCIAIQSNAPFVENSNKNATPHVTVKAVSHVDCPADVLRLNSGLYVAPRNPLVITAFEEIVHHAATSRLSEQPSFDKSTYRAARLTSSFSSASASLHVHLFDRFQFPNGAVLVGPDNDNVYNLGREKFANATGQELVAAHNNWISGETEKKTRQVAAGWWFIDREEDLFECKQHGDENESLQ